MRKDRETRKLHDASDHISKTDCIGETDRIGFYFRQEKWVLLIVTVTGILYNVGLVAGPWFEGQMVQCLCDILGRKKEPGEMILLAAAYVLTILFVQAMRYLKRLYVRKFANNISKTMKKTLFWNLLHRKRSEQEEAGAMMTKLISDADACVEGMRKFTTEVFDTGVVMAAYLVMLLLSYVPVFPAFLKLRENDPERERPFRVPGGSGLLKLMSYVPMVLIIVSIIFTAVPLSFDAETLAGTLPILIGAVLFVVLGEIMLCVKKVKR